MFQCDVNTSICLGFVFHAYFYIGFSPISANVVTSQNVLHIDSYIEAYIHIEASFLCKTQIKEMKTDYIKEEQYKNAFLFQRTNKEYITG